MNAPIDLRDVVLHTPRLTLRPWRLSDLDDFYAYAREDGVGRWPAGCPQKPGGNPKILDLFIGQHKTFALEYQGGVVGSLGVECYDEEHYPELAAYRGRRSAMSWPNPAGAGA